jgi:hypothetical protein
MDARLLPLQNALNKLLADTDQYVPEPFTNRVWPFLHALCDVRGGEALLTEYGSLIERLTGPNTEYATAWRNGVRAALRTDPAATIEVRAHNLGTGPPVLVRHESALFKMRKASRQKHMLFEITLLRDTIRHALDGEIHPREREAIAAWCDSLNAIVSRAENFHSDACRLLLEMQRFGVDSYAAGAVDIKNGAHLGPNIKRAAAFLLKPA